MSMSASKIFTGYRALGFVSTDVPFAIRYNKKHKENYVVTSVGQAFHVYNCSKLGIVSVSDLHPEPISVVVSSQRHIFTACANVIRCFDKGRKVIHLYEGHTSDVTYLLPFGAHLVSVDCSGRVIVWDAHNEGLYLSKTFDPESFEITAVAHPYGYVNKILLGSRQGSLYLWNIKHDKLVYTFTGWGQQVTLLQQSPAADVVAIGLADGRIYLHNLRCDETVVKFKQDWGAVTGVSFRTDGHPTMVTGSAAGHIAFWDLEARALKSQELQAHGKAVTGLQCLPQEPILVTSSGDNTLKVWIFDQPDGGVRLLRMREGHSAPPTFIRHYGNDGHKILTAAQDSYLRLFSTIHDKHNSSLGRASFNKSATKRAGLKHDQHKMPPVTVFAAESGRASDWDDVACCHQGLRMVSTWSSVRSTMGRHKLDCARFHHGAHRSVTAQAVDVSACGNFVAVGYSSGHVDVYNMQSGKHRGSFGDPKAHKGSVRGVTFDAYNTLLITAGDDLELKFWRFGSRDRVRVLLKELKMTTGIKTIRLHRESAMLAVVLEDFTVSVLDLDTLKVVRSFTGHSNTILDLTFSGDGRWVITSSLDCTVCTWSMVHGSLIDCFAVTSPVTSLSMSPTDDFLATSHIGDVGVYLWANKALYSFLSLQSLPEDFEPAVIALPATAERPEDDVKEEADEEVIDYEGSEFKSPEQISEELVTLSCLPTSRWLNLLHLDVIKERNKPKEPVKIPKSAPFFLPTVAGLQPVFAAPANTDAEQDHSRIVKADVHAASEFAQILLSCSQEDSYQRALDKLKEQGAFAIEADIRSLETDDERLAFLDFVNSILRTRRDFDLINGYLGLFIKVHHEDLQNCEEAEEKLADVQQSVTEAFTDIDSKMQQCLCLGKYMCSAKLS